MKNISVPYQSARPLYGQGQRPLFGSFGSPVGTSIANKGLSLAASGATSAAVGAGATALGIGAGAAMGSVVPIIGTVVGAVVGLLAGSLIHQGQGPQRAAEAARIMGLLNQLTSAAGVGRQLPWNDTKNGLFQYLEDTMLGGRFMGDWAGSNFTTSPTNMGNWATTFINGVKQIMSAIKNNPVGATVSIDITNSPGGQNARPGPFVFRNPGLAAGPDAIAANVLMPYAGYAINRTGETPAHAASTMASVPARKVFAMMADKWMAENPVAVAAPVAATPQPLSSTAVVYNPIQASPIQTTPATVVGSTPAGTPIVPVDQTAALIRQLQAQGLSSQQAINAAMQSLQAQGMQITPQVQQQLAADAGTSATQAGIGNLPSWVWIGAAGLAAISFALARPVGPSRPPSSKRFIR